MMWTGRCGAAAAVGGLVAGVLVTGGGAAGAQVPTDYLVLAGNFVGDARDEALYYAPGTVPEFLIDFSKDGAGNAFQNLLGEFTVNGSYKPLVGDLDGDGYDEILWYAPGTTTDYLWNFTSGSTVQSVPYTANGNYARPTVGDFTGDGVDDVLWYAPGPAQDYLWEFNSGGGYLGQPKTINGNYIPVSGSVGNDATDDIVWYSPGAAPDYLWDFRPGSTLFDAVTYAVSATGYRPFSLDMWGDGPGSEDIFWYAPGPAGDYTWDYLGGTRTVVAEQVNGHYLTAAGDFFNDGVEDILFDTYDRTIVWDHTPAGERWAYTWTYDLSVASQGDGSLGRASRGGETSRGGAIARGSQLPLTTRP
jgi:hypothetical protein